MVSDKISDKIYHQTQQRCKWCSCPRWERSQIFVWKVIIQQKRTRELLVLAKNTNYKKTLAQVVCIFIVLCYMSNLTPLLFSQKCANVPSAILIIRWFLSFKLILTFMVMLFLVCSLGQTKYHCRQRGQRLCLGSYNPGNKEMHALAKI